MTIRFVQKFDPKFPRTTNISKFQALLLIGCVGLGLLFTSPVWVPIIISIFGVQPPVVTAIPVFKIIDGCTDAVFSPADASVKIYDPHGLTSMPAADVPAFDLIDTLSETPDGEFTATRALPVGAWIYVYATGTNWYTAGWFLQVNPLGPGTSGEAIAETLKMYENSGTITADISGMLVSGGVEIDGDDATNNVTFGSASYRLDLTAAENYAFAYNDYVDPTTGYLYKGTIVVLDLDLTTARCTVTGASIFEHFTIGTHEYWVLSVPQFWNDAEYSDDGTYSLHFTIDVSVGADDAMDIGYHVARRPSQIKQASFGTDYENNDDKLDNLNFATS